MQTIDRPLSFLFAGSGRAQEAGVCVNSLEKLKTHQDSWWLKQDEWTDLSSFAKCHPKAECATNEIFSTARMGGSYLFSVGIDNG